MENNIIKPDRILRYCYTANELDFYKDDAGWLYVSKGENNVLHSVPAHPHKKETFIDKVKRFFGNKSAYYKTIFSTNEKD